MRYFKQASLALLMAAGLAACGETPLEQGLMGAGAGAGAAIVTGGSTKTGALLGGLANLAYCQENPGRCR